MALALRHPADTPARGAEIVDIRHLSARDLDPLLQEQTLEWDLELDWDLSKSADLVRRFADARELGGVALLDGDEIAGYGYFGLTNHKGHICDVYVRPRWRSGNAEAILFRVMLDTLMDTPGVRRIESQLMLAQAAEASALQRACPVRSFERLLMKLDANTALPPGRASTAKRFCLEPWEDHHHDAGAAVLSLAHARHIDSQMSDQYRTFAGTSRFLHDLVRFPGSSTFCRPASYIAFDRTTGQAAGIALASFVAAGVGHIAELCVTPGAQGAGLGYELLRHSVTTLGAAGAKCISLTVTAANADALRLYSRCGFREARRFYAFLWERH